VYLSDPDGNDLELAWDRPPEEWRPFGTAMDGKLELEELLSHRP
jgi:catechol-2,3-dioxygenase